MLKKKCHQVLGSQKSKLTPPDLVFQTAGAINPPPYKDRVKTDYFQALNKKKLLYWRINNKNKDISI